MTIGKPQQVCVACVRERKRDESDRLNENEKKKEAAQALAGGTNIRLERNPKPQVGFRRKWAARI